MTNHFGWKLVILIPILAGIALAPVKAQSAATQIDHARVDAAFAKEMPLLETNNFKIHASRRETPGLAEIHTRDTDIVYVLEGAAPLVTGGKALQSKTIAPGEIRGKAIEGGEVRHIVKGDVVVIPNGVPHWFTTVDGPLLYYVVKVTN
jgi:mannose-6-phosphate isomerase-like protein (cupin superfamily)